jgi:hypothetical protein
VIDAESDPLSAYKDLPREIEVAGVLWPLTFDAEDKPSYRYEIDLWLQYPETRHPLEFMIYQWFSEDDDAPLDIWEVVVYIGTEGESFCHRRFDTLAEAIAHAAKLWTDPRTWAQRPEGV